MKKIFAGSIVVVLSCIALPVLAQYTGPTRQAEVRTAAQASKSADKTPVTLEGFLAAKIRDEHYTFEDESGVIEVEIDHKYFPTTPVSEKTRLRLHGKVDKDFAREATVDVKQVEILGR